MDDILLSGLGDVARGSWADAYFFVRNFDSRQLTMASFAVQAKLLGPDPVISRGINILVHLVNCALAWRVARLAACRAGYASLAPALATMVALTWAVFPIHATTVLYPIQRMTLLGATGSLVVFVLVLGRLNFRRMLWAVLAYVLAILAKENAVLAMPVAFIARGLLSRRLHTRRLVYQGLSIVSTAFIGLVVLFNVQLESVLRYSAWDFSLMDRMLVAPRILAEYATSIILPWPNDFSFYHDDYLADSARPLSSLYVVALGAAPLMFLFLSRIANRNRLVATGIAFFVLLHTVESTAIALDLYFEHRNYLPSLGLAMSMAPIWIQRRKLAGRTRGAFALLYLCSLLCILGYRSHIIGNEVALTRHHLATHPTSFRSILDASYFGVDFSPDVLDHFPYPIELQAIALRSICEGTQPSIDSRLYSGYGPVPKRSLRLHVDTLAGCARPCLIPRRYLFRLANAYLLDERKDSYRRRVDKQLMQTRRQRIEIGCVR